MGWHTWTDGQGMFRAKWTVCFSPQQSIALVFAVSIGNRSGQSGVTLCNKQLVVCILCIDR